MGPTLKFAERRRQIRGAEHLPASGAFHRLSASQGLYFSPSFRSRIDLAATSVVRTPAGVAALHDVVQALLVAEVTVVIDREQVAELVESQAPADLRRKP